VSLIESLCTGDVMADTPIDTTPGSKTAKISRNDKFHLIKLALEAKVREKKLELARIEWEQANAASEAAGDAIAAKMRIPHEARDVTIDLNEGIIRYQMPGVPPDAEVAE
jgi:hypothetical protein